MQSVEQLLDRAEAHERAGQTWRSKEILQGAIASGRLSPEVLEAYGRLLDAAGDRVEAGKYLFLSGVRLPEYDAAISLFVQRHGKDVDNFVAQFPTRLRRRPLGEWPESVRADLRQMGVSDSLFERPARPRPTPFGWRDRIAVGAALIVLIGFILALVLGLRDIGSWLWDRLVS